MSEVIDRAVQQLGYTATKEHQRTVVEGLVGGKDVFGIQCNLDYPDSFVSPKNCRCLDN